MEAAIKGAQDSSATVVKPRGRTQPGESVKKSDPHAWDGPIGKKIGPPPWESVEHFQGSREQKGRKKEKK